MAKSKKSKAFKKIKAGVDDAVAFARNDESRGKVVSGHNHCDMYRIIDTRTRKAVAVNFENRQAAKPQRDELNAVHPDRYIVSRGKDHPLGPSNGIAKQTRGKNSRW